VREENSGRPLESLLVQAYDKDVVFDDFLGSAHTDSNGRFEIHYTELDFRDVIEQRPDVYVRVFDPSGKTELLSTIKTRIEEHFDIAIPAAKIQAMKTDRLIARPTGRPFLSSACFFSSHRVELGSPLSRRAEIGERLVGGEAL